MQILPQQVVRRRVSEHSEGGLIAERAPPLAVDTVNRFGRGIQDQLHMLDALLNQRGEPLRTGAKAVRIQPVRCDGAEHAPAENQHIKPPSLVEMRFENETYRVPGFVPQSVIV